MTFSHRLANPIPLRCRAGIEQLWNELHVALPERAARLGRTNVGTRLSAVPGQHIGYRGERASPTALLIHLERSLARQPSLSAGRTNSLNGLPGELCLDRTHRLVEMGSLGSQSVGKFRTIHFFYASLPEQVVDKIITFSARGRFPSCA